MSKTNEKKAEIKDIIRSNGEIKKLIKETMRSKGYSYSFLIEETMNEGIFLCKASLSRYLTSEGMVKGLPTQEAILFLCSFMKINIELTINGKKESMVRN